MRKRINWFEVIPVVIMVGLAITLVLGIITSKAKAEEVPQEILYFDYPEEWKAITTDTMQVIRTGDTLHLYFIQKE